MTKTNERVAATDPSLCPSFGTDCEPTHPACRACHLQLQCLAGLRLTNTANAERLKQELWDGVAYMDEFPSDIKAVIAALSAELVEGVAGLIRQGKEPLDSTVREWITGSLAEAKVHDPFFAGMLVQSLFGAGFKQEGETWSRP